MLLKGLDGWTVRSHFQDTADPKDQRGGQRIYVRTLTSVSYNSKKPQSQSASARGTGK